MPDFAYIINRELNYSEPPYHPPESYPEFNNIFKEFDGSNKIYEGVRVLFIEKGLDISNIGTIKWNPFRNIIKNNYSIVIKPNFVLDERGKVKGKKCITTQADIIRPILDYIYLLQIQEKIKVEVRICDVPIQGADFEKLINENGVKELVEYYNQHFDLDLQILDLRDLITYVDKNHYLYSKKVEGDPRGYSIIHLKDSFLNEIVDEYKKFGAPGYGFDNTSEKHAKKGYHYYHIPNTVLNCDLFINVPKLKTHKKAGITIALKNLIGIVGDKSWIPHFRRGSIKSGGDEFDEKNRFLKSITTKSSYYLQGKSKIVWRLARGINEKIVKKYFREDYSKKVLTEYERKLKFLVNGDWYRNDTVWRPILDLNYILWYSNKKGEIKENIQRSYLCITDGIIGGEGDGPLEPEPRRTCFLSICMNPIINDICVSRIMGFDWNKIPQLKRSEKIWDSFEYDGNLKNINIMGCNRNNKINSDFIETKFEDLPNLNFLPPPGWKGFIELNR